MACPICGGNCKDYTPSPGAGVHITRLGRGVTDMASNVTLSKERWYVTADKKRAVREGDPDAAYLLVGKDGAIAPEVAAHYGIETYTGQAVARVAQDREAERSRMVREGTSKETAVNYEEMAISRSIRESVNSSITKEDNRSAGRQASMMADAIIAEAKESGEAAALGSSPEPVSRTKEIAPGNSGGSDAPGKPDGGGETSSGQAPENPGKDLKELEDAVNKTL